MTDYEQLARIREAWPAFLQTIGPRNETYARSARTITVGRTATPICDPVAFRAGELTVAARRQHEEEYIRNDLAAAPRDRVAAAFGDGVVTRFNVVAREDAVAILQEELAAVGLQVQRLIAHVTGKV